MRTKIILAAILVVMLLIPFNTGMAQDPTGTTAEPEFIATVTTSVANIYEQPNSSSDVIGAASVGQRLPIVGQPADGTAFYQIELRSTRLGYVAAADVNVELYEAPAILAPEEATMYITLDTSPGMFDRMDTFYTVLNAGERGAFIRDEVDSLLSLLFLNPDIDLDQIRRWLGDEVSIVNLRCLSSSMANYIMEDTAQSTPSAEVVVLASVLDEAGAQAFIDTQFENGEYSDIPNVEVEYEGYTYRLLSETLEEAGEPERPVVAMGIVDEHIVFTQGRSSFETVIDVANGVTPALSETERFDEVYGELDNDSFLRVYIGPSLYCPVHDPVLYDALLRDAFTEGALDIEGVDDENLDELQESIRALIDDAFQGYALGFREDGSGVTLDFVSGADLEALRELTGLPEERLDEINTQMGLELFGFLTPYTLETLTFGTLTADYDALSNLSADTQDDMFERGTGITSDVLEFIEGSITMGFIDYPVFDAEIDTQAHFFMILEPSIKDDVDQIEAAYEAFVEAAIDGGATVTDDDIRETDFSTVTRIVTSDGDFERVLEVGPVNENYLLIATGDNWDRIVEVSRGADGEFTPDWRLLADLSLDRSTVPATDENGNEVFTDGFVGAMDFSAFIQGGRLEVAAIVAPPLEPGQPSRISIICAICRDGERCYENSSLDNVPDVSDFSGAE